MAGVRLHAMAWRNLWRNRRRTLITLSSLAFGVLLAVLLTGMSDWRWREVINMAASMGGGHVTIQHPDLLDNPSVRKTVVHGDQVRQRVMADAGVVRVVSRISGQVMLSTAAQTYGAGFVAFDPNQEDASTFAVFDSVVEGEMFSATDAPGIVLGSKLAENLEAKLGRKVVYTLTDKQGEIVTGLARVVGIVGTGAPTVDATLCLLPIDTVRDILGYGPHETTQLAVFITDHRDADGAAAKLNRLVAPEATALTWAAVNPSLAGFITMKVVGMQFMEIFMLILIGAGIFNTLFVSVMERLREFGVLLAIGFSPARLFRLVLWESTWVAVAGIALGSVVTAPLYYYLATTGLDLTGAVGESDLEIAGAAMEPILRVAIYPENAIAVALVIIAATLLSGLYPAWRASRVTPVDAIKLV